MLGSSCGGRVGTSSRTSPSIGVGPGEGERPGPPAPAKEAELIEEEEASRSKKKKKEKKNKRKDRSVNDGRTPKKASQKKVEVLFAGTGLDPSDKVQKKVMRRARKFLDKKRRRDRSSSGGSQEEDGSSGSSSSGGEVNLEGIFAEESKPRALAERFPGLLTMDTIKSMRRSLLTAEGEEVSGGGVRPVALLYYRNQLSKRATGAQGRELLNLCSALDQLLKGQVAQAADVLSQRIKAQEAILHGTTWTIAQRMEITAPESSLLVARGELVGVQKEDYDEAKAKWKSQYGGKKGDAKGKTKGPKGSQTWGKDGKKDDDRQKGKGGDKK